MHSQRDTAQESFQHDVWYEHWVWTSLPSFQGQRKHWDGTDTVVSHLGLIRVNHWASRVKMKRSPLVGNSIYLSTWENNCLPRRCWRALLFRQKRPNENCNKNVYVPRLATSQYQHGNCSPLHINLSTRPRFPCTRIAEHTLGVTRSYLSEQ